MEAADDWVDQWAQAPATYRMPFGPEPLGSASLVLQPPATPSAVADVEAGLGTSLPPTYRSFVLHSNGAAVGTDGTPWVGCCQSRKLFGCGDADPDWIEAWSIPEFVDTGFHPEPGSPIDVNYFRPAANAVLISARVA